MCGQKGNVCMQVGHQCCQDGRLDHPELCAPLLPCSAGHHLRLQVSRLTHVLTTTACTPHRGCCAAHSSATCWACLLALDTMLLLCVVLSLLLRFVGMVRDYSPGHHVPLFHPIPCHTISFHLWRLKLSCMINQSLLAALACASNRCKGALHGCCAQLIVWDLAAASKQLSFQSRL